MQIFNKERLVFNFKLKRKQTTQRQEEYIDRKVKKFPKVVFTIFLIYFLLFAAYISWYMYFRDTYLLSEVVGISMKDTLNPEIDNTEGSDDLVYINIKRNPKQFDIITIGGYRDSNGKSVTLIKRAIALAGDLVTIKVGNDGYYHVYTYDEDLEKETQLPEDYVKDPYEWRTNHISHTYNGVAYENLFFNTFFSSTSKYADKPELKVEKNGTLFFRVPEYEIFFLGDNRAHSSDARERGTAKIANVQGVVDMILPNANKPGANVLGIKTKAILNFYWPKVVNYFER